MYHLDNLLNKNSNKHNHCKYRRYLYYHWHIYLLDILLNKHYLINKLLLDILSILLQYLHIHHIMMGKLNKIFHLLHNQLDINEHNKYPSKRINYRLYIHYCYYLRKYQLDKLQYKLLDLRMILFHKLYMNFHLYTSCKYLDKFDIILFQYYHMYLQGTLLNNFLHCK